MRVFPLAKTEDVRDSVVSRHRKTHLTHLSHALPTLFDCQPYTKSFTLPTGKEGFSCGLGKGTLYLFRFPSWVFLVLAPRVVGEDRV